MRAYLSQMFSFMRGRPDHPVYRKEITGWSYVNLWRNLRSGCLPIILGLFSLTALGCGLLTLLAVVQDTSVDWPLKLMLAIGVGVLGLFYVGEIVLLIAGLMATVLTSTSISAELENDSYGLMRLTMIPPREIILAKFGAAMHEMRRPIISVLATRTIFMIAIPLLLVVYIAYTVGTALGASSGIPPSTPAPTNPGLAPLTAVPFAFAPLIAMMATSALVAVAIGIAVLLYIVYYFIQPTLDMMLFSAVGVAASTIARTRSSGLFAGLGFRVGLWATACVANQIFSSAVSFIMTPIVYLGSTNNALMQSLANNPALLVAGYAGATILTMVVIMAGEFGITILMLRFAENRANLLPFDA